MRCLSMRLKISQALRNYCRTTGTKPDFTGGRRCDCSIVCRPLSGFFINRRTSKLISWPGNRPRTIFWRPSKPGSAINWQWTTIAIVSIADISRQHYFVNDKFCQVSQYKREELVGQNHRILILGFIPCILRGDVAHHFSRKSMAR